MIEQLTNRYRVLSLLGQGGMGSVYLAEDATTQDKVALKTLSLQQAADPDEAMAQFRQEFRTMARLRHPNLVEVYDFGQLDDGTPFFTMEVVPGRGLDECVPLPLDEFGGIVSQLCQALSYIHQQGMVHCDIKPENIRLTPEGQLKLMDFGLMSPTGQSGGAIKGTIHYLAPEVARRAKVDARSDLYSVGALAYHLLAGRVPFPGDDPLEVLRAHLETEPEPISSLRPEVSEDVEHLVMRLLAKDPLARYQSAQEVLADLGVASEEDDKGTLFSSPFVGRQEPLKAFEAHLSDLGNGQGGLLRLSGEAGSGKSRLLEEFRFQAQLAGRQVVGGRCQEGALPYGVFADALRQAIAQLPAEALEPLRPSLAGLLPELDPEGRSVALDPQKEKARLQAAISDLLALVARSGGLAVMLDDWQWADGSSQELLGLLGRSLAIQPVLFVVAGRDSADEALELGALAGEEVREMAEAILGSREIDAPFVEQLAELTSGNPFFVESALRHLWQEGTLRRELGHWVTEGLALSSANLPADVHNLLLSRLAQLSPGARAVADLAATMGQPFPAARLRRLSGLEEDTLFEALTELGSEGILRVDEGTVRFVGGQYAEVLYGQLTEDARTTLHTRIAAFLSEDLAGDDRLEALFELARHHLASDAPRTGVGYALAAATKSFALFGLSQARHLLETGLPYVDNPADRLGFVHLLGDIARFSSQLDPAREYYHQALSLARDLGRAATQASLTYNLGILDQIASKYDAALDRMRAALALLEEQPDPTEQVRILVAMGRLFNFKGDAAAAISATEQALSTARELGDLGNISNSLGFLGLMYVQGAPDRIETGMGYLEESKAIKEQLGDKRGLSDTLNLLGNAQMMTGRYAEAYATFERTLVACRELGIRDDEICAMINLALVGFELGKFAEAAEYSRQAYEASAASGNMLYKGIAMVAWAENLAHAGEIAAAVERLAEADALAAEVKNSYLDVTVVTYGIEVELMAGRLVEALKRAERAEALVASSGINEYERKQWALQAELLARFGEPAEAEALVDRLLSWAEENRAPGVRARALMVRALVQGRAPAMDRWVPSAEEAIAAAAACAMGELEAYCRWWLGVQLLRLGRNREAREAFELAKAFAETAPSARLKAMATFGVAQSEHRSTKSYQILPTARAALEELRGKAGGDEAREDLLALDELWRVWIADLVPPAAPDAEGPGGVSEARYQAVLQQTQLLQTQLDEVEAINKSFEQLLDFAAEAQTLTELGPLLDRVVMMVKEMAGADRGFILLKEKEGEPLKIKASTIDYRQRNPKLWQYSESLAEEAYSTGRTVYHHDAIEPTPLSKSIMDLQIRTVLCVPLVHRGNVLGVIYVDKKSVTEKFGDRERHAVETLATQAAQAIVNARLYIESEAHSRQLEMLNTLARTVSTTLVLSEVIDTVIDFTLKLTGADRCFILLTDDGEQLRCHQAKDRSGNVLTDSGEKVSSSITHRVLSTQEAECVLDTRDHEKFQAQQSILDLNLRTVMCVPLVVKQEALGVLYVDSQAVVNAFTDRDLDLLKAIASQASVAIQTAKLYERATVDGLTRLYVRSYFEQRLAHEVRRAVRYGPPLSLMMMDIDHFKKFNDTYGHATGDDVLKLVASVIKGRIREDLDIAGRFGGEEMLVLMPETDAKGAMVLAERLREAIATTDLPGPNGEILHVNVSIGVAAVPQHASTPVELIELADQALYRSKRAGRNRVTLYDPAAPAEEGH